MLAGRASIRGLTPELCITGLVPPFIKLLFGTLPTIRLENAVEFRPDIRVKLTMDDAIFRAWLSGFTQAKI
jgi:hypothetical protein